MAKTRKPSRRPSASRRPSPDRAPSSGRRKPAPGARATAIPPARPDTADAAVDDGEALVVYIHGIGRQLPPADLKLEWDLALFGRDRGAATRMAYWADILHPARERRTRAMGGAESLETEAILAEAGVSPRDADARAYVASLRRAYGVDEVPAGRGPRTKVVPLPGIIREPLARAFLKAFIRDTAAYFFDAGTRAAIRRRLVDVLPAGGQAVTLVAHSQGSIVALEVLAAVSDLHVTKLVTIGSPLGLTEVQDQLDVPPRRPPFDIPGCVERWDNFADRLDPVALDGRLASDFGPRDVLAIRQPVRVVDRAIVNRQTTRVFGFNPHSAVGYLAHPEVRKSVHEASHFDSMARFVVARDVSEALGQDGRHPVLIEILEPGYKAVDESDAAHAAREKESAPHLAERIARAERDLAALVERTAGEAGLSAREVKAAVEAARIDPLKRFVAAHLTPAELRRVAHEHRDFNVYAVWRSATKRKLLHRSRAVLQVDAAIESYRASGRGVRWAVLDTGVRHDHPHFQIAGGGSRISAIWDCTRRGRPVPAPADLDPDGHGSHVCGIITGSGDANGQTFTGLAPEAEIVVYKVLDDRGEGEDAWIVKALDHIAEFNENNPTKAIHGLNLSLGGPYDSTVYGCGYSPICQELRRLWRNGTVVVVACGNEGQLDVQTRDGEVALNTPMSIGDPANLEDCIAVGSVNADKPNLYGISPFSSRGPTSDGRCKPDVVAPGERITSVNARFSGRARLYRVESGTSMAAPHVSGLIAGFLSVRPEFRGRPDEVKKLLLDTCTDIGRDRQHQGRGIPNLMKMLLNA
jgi:subtilisin family serine protease